MDIWEHQKPINEIEGYDFDVPRFIDQDITGNNIAAICQGGCASGAYMPAVTYHTAKETMNEHGDDVLQFIQDHMGELPTPDPGESWAGMACFFLSYAVELWASSVHDEVEAAVADIEDDEEAAE